MLPRIVAVLGPDRVGKSTFVENSYATISEFANVSKLHFSGPQPTHNDPITQYIEPLNKIMSAESPEYILCDRGFSEVCFYEKFRRNIVISEQWAIAAESYFFSVSKSLDVLVIERDWEWARNNHIKEIDELFPDATNYYKNNQLIVRENEHKRYYEYMKNYLENASTLPYQIIQPKLGESVLDYILV
jgi:hypothetical protein